MVGCGLPTAEYAQQPKPKGRHTLGDAPEPGVMAGS